MRKRKGRKRRGREREREGEGGRKGGERDKCFWGFWGVFFMSRQSQ